MRVDKKRVKEIDTEMEALKAAMEEASKKGDWDLYARLQERYNEFLQMQLSIGNSKKDKAGNGINIAKIVVDFLGVLATAFVGILGIRSAVKADEEDILVNQRSWNIGLDFMKKKK